MSVTLSTPADHIRALQHVKLAADLGRELADLGVLMFRAPFPLALRELFAGSMIEGMPDLMDDWHALPDTDRAYLLRVAETIFDRRLSMHAASLQFGGRA